MSRRRHDGPDRKGPQLTWAIGSNGEPAHISEMERGLKCACTCPMCGSDLVAKQGKVQEHHFAHAKDAECAHAVETALHLAAKDILAKRREIVLPAVEITFPHSTRRTIIAPEQRYAIESVDVEQKLGAIIPDVIARIRGRELLVEITVTHGVDGGKLKKIKELGLSCIEIDLSDVDRDLSRENLEKMVADETTHKRWVHNVRADEKLRKMLSQATLLQTVHRGLADHADGCPIPARVWNGKPYANMIDDCAYCEHRLLIDFDIGVICDGFRALGKQQPPERLAPRPPPEAFEHPEEEDPMRALGRWLNEMLPAETEMSIEDVEGAWEGLSSWTTSGEKPTAFISKGANGAPRVKVICGAGWAKEDGTGRAAIDAGVLRVDYGEHGRFSFTLHGSVRKGKREEKSILSGRYEDGSNPYRPNPWDINMIRAGQEG